MSSRDLRSILHEGFTFVRSVEANKATAAVTLDHVIRKQISFLKKGEVRSIVDASGESMGNRVSRYDQLQALLDEVNACVDVVAKADQSEDPTAALRDLGIFEVDLSVGAP